MLERCKEGCKTFKEEAMEKLEDKIFLMKKKAFKYDAILEHFEDKKSLSRKELQDIVSKINDKYEVKENAKIL